MPPSAEDARKRRDEAWARAAGGGQQEEEQEEESKEDAVAEPAAPRTRAPRPTPQQLLGRRPRPRLTYSWDTIRQLLLLREWARAYERIQQRRREREALSPALPQGSLGMRRQLDALRALRYGPRPLTPREREMVAIMERETGL